MRAPLSILTIQPHDQAGMERARLFAEGFGHNIKALHMPVHVVCRGEKWMAFFQRMPMIVCSPNFHTSPDICSTRDTLEISHLISEVAMFVDGACVVEADPNGKFTPEIMAHIGFVPRGTVLFQKEGN